MHKDFLKPRLEEYITAVGGTRDKKAGKDMFTCPVCHSGNNKDGALHVTGEKWFCHSCHKGGDIFTMAELLNNTTNFTDTMQVVCEALNIDYTKDFTNVPPVKKESPAPQQKPSIDYTPFLEDCARNCVDYFYTRGISQATIQKFKLGIINATTLANYTVSHRLTNGLRVGDVTIPYFDEQGKIIYFIARATNVEANGKSQYPKFKKPQTEYAGSEPVYNYPALYQKEKPVFVVEGQIDALSIEELGGKAIALNGTGADKLRPYLEKIQCPGIIIALDNDRAGQEASKELATKLSELHSRKFSYEFFKHQQGIKDINAALLHNRAKLAGQIEYYNRKYSNTNEQAERNHQPTADFVQTFLNQIKERKQTQSISTGFKNIDELLDGGIRAGLYFIGAVSSLGKTALTLQIADNIAAKGQDVLFISLEMARSELMARTISRYTYEYAQQNFPLDFFAEGQGKIPRTALTTTGVLQGKIISENQSKSFESAVNRYAAEAGQHLFIVEGVGNIGYAEVRKFVEEHQATHGTLPVLIIDYIQLLGIADNSAASDKQKIDKAVMELKRLSRDFNISIIGISSLNRESYNKSMTMSAFKESGAVEYTADVLIGLQVTGIENKNSDYEQLLKDNEEKIKKALPVKIDFKILKNRNGRRGTTQLNFISMFNFYEDTEIEKPMEKPTKKIIKV